MAPGPTVVDALLFDLGNVLVEIDFRRAFTRWAQEAGVPVDLISRRFSFDAPYEAHERGEIGSAQYFASLRKSLGVSLSDAQLLDGWNAIFVRPVPGIAALLPVLASALPLHVFSNTNALHHAFWTAQYRDVLVPFSHIFCSYSIGLRKPQPAAFEHVVARIGVAPSRVAFFDDQVDNVRGAQQAGLIAFHVTSMSMLRNALSAELHLFVPSDPERSKE